MIDLIKQRARTARWLAKNPSYPAAYYKANKDKYKEYTNRHAALRYELVNNAKSRPCMDCGAEYPPFIMDLDHRPGEVKVNCVAHLVNRHARIEVIRTEIDKCDVVCSNCHRFRTWNRKQK